MSETPIEGRIIEPNTTTIYWVPGGMNPEAPTAADLAGAIKLEGVTVAEPSIDKGSDWDTPVRTATTRAEGWMEQHGMKLYDWQRPYVEGILGRFDYTPADELRDRLNDRIQGKQPTLAVNTSYWRGL